MSTVDQTSAATPVALADVRAPHLTAWDRLVAATDPLVPSGQPNPFDAPTAVPWCVRCQEAVHGERDVAHPVGEERENHRSDAAHVRLRWGGQAEPEPEGYRLPSLDVRLKAATTAQAPLPMVDVWRTSAEGTAHVAHLTLAEARELVRVLEAAVDLATGRDDFDAPGAASTEAHR